ncbi:uncharacterized protein PAE49_021747 [Odontesthes bonariensis]
METSALLGMCLSLAASVFGDQRIITAEPGDNVTLTYGAPNSSIPIIVVEWSRADLDKEYVLVYRDGQFYLEGQHPSFKDRVDLQDRRMKDGDVSLILEDVTTEDRGTYEFRVKQKETKRRKRYLYTFGFMILSFLLFGVGGYLAYQEIKKMRTAFEGVGRAINTQTEMLRERNRKLDATLTQVRRLAEVPGLRREME